MSVVGKKLSEINNLKGCEYVSYKGKEWKIDDKNMFGFKKGVKISEVNKSNNVVLLMGSQLSQATVTKCVCLMDNM